MSTLLTQAQRDLLDQALADAQLQQDPLLYYNVLATIDTRYAPLAMGVIQRNTLAGITANLYAQNKLVGDLGLSFTESERHELMMTLIELDSLARTVGSVVQLPGQQISNYHDEAFLQVFGAARAQEAWTAFHLVRLYDYDVFLAGEGQDYFGGIYLSTRLQAHYLDPSDPNYENAYEWAQDMAVGLVLDRRTWSFGFGDGVWYAALQEYQPPWGINDLNQLMDLLGELPGMLNIGIELMIHGIAHSRLGNLDLGLSYAYGSNGDAHYFNIARADFLGAHEDWIFDVTLGAKWAALGGPTLNETVWTQMIESSGPNAAVLQAIDAISFDAVILGASGLLSAQEFAFVSFEENTLVVGTGGGSDLLGAWGDDVLVSTGGGNRLRGWVGDDVIVASGNDLIYGDWGIDVIHLNGGGNKVAMGLGVDIIHGATYSDRIGFRLELVDPSAYITSEHDQPGTGLEFAERYLFPVMGGFAESENSNRFRHVSGTYIGEWRFTDLAEWGWVSIENHPSYFEEYSLSVGQPVDRMIEITYVWGGIDTHVQQALGSNYTVLSTDLVISFAYSSNLGSHVSYAVMVDFQAGDAGIQLYGPGGPANVDTSMYGKVAYINNFGAYLSTVWEPGGGAGAPPAGPPQAPPPVGPPEPTVTGTTGDDVLVGDPGDNHIRGLDGDDVLVGIAGNNILDGGPGDDVLVAGTGIDSFVLRAGDGNDQVFDFNNGRARIALAGGLTPEVLRFVDYGTASLLEAPDGTSFWLHDVTGILKSDIAFYDFDTGALLSGSVARVIEGTAGDDMLLGAYENNVLIGGAGDDVLEGIAGNNVLDGGLGDDVLVAGSGFDTFVFRAGDGNDQVWQFDPNRDRIALDGLSPEALRFVDHGTASLLEAPDGTSFWLHGLTGILKSDIVFVDLATGALRNASAPRVIEGTAGDDMLLGAYENNVLIGGAGDDVLEGIAGNNVLDGGLGDDVLVAGSGFDTFVFRAGDGNDQVWDFDPSRDRIALDGLTPEILRFVDHGTASLLEAPDGTSFWFHGLTGILKSDIVFVDVATGALLDAGAPRTIIGTSGDDSLIGAHENNLLLGGAGGDFLWGIAGDNILDGGAGNDFMRSGSGIDTFVFRLGDGDDVIEFFDPTRDRIALDGISAADLDITDYGSGTSIEAPDGTSFWLIGVTGTPLEQFNFV